MSDWLIRLEEFLNYGWDIGEWAINVRMIFFAIFIAIIGFVIRKFITGNILSFFRKNDTIGEKSEIKLHRIINAIVFIATCIGILRILDLDYVFFKFPVDSFGEGTATYSHVPIRVSTFLLPLIIFKIAQLADWLATNIAIGKYSQSRLQANAQYSEKEEQEVKKASRAVRYLIYILAIIISLRWLNLDFGADPLQKSGHFTINNILAAATTFIIAWLVVWLLTKVILRTYYSRNDIDVGNRYAFNQLLKYFVYVIAGIFALQNNLAFDMNYLLGGAAALLVGIGLGLQQTFNDLVSGIILLFERTIEVGDVVEANGLVGTVTSIGIRTSVVLIRDNTSVVVPNSKFITENVVNWSHTDEKQVRFSIPVGVAYGSDTELVKKTLLRVAEDNPDILQRPASFVRFVDFADSSLNFELHFWSRNFIRIEDVKSDLRFQIDAAFRHKDIEIPFPQRVVWSPNSDKDAN